MTALVAAIVRLLEDPQDQVLARLILGTTDARAIANRVEIFVADHLGRAVVGCSLFTQSVGAVFGLELDDGARVVVKAHAIGGGRMRGPATLAELHAVYAAQAHFAAAGVPCARVLVPPRTWPGGAAAIMSFVEAPLPSATDDPHAPAARAALAGLLARSVELGRGVDATDLPRVTMPAATLFAPPHNALFDLDAPGGAWIDARARAARAVLDATPERPVVLHSDVSAANVRVVGGAIAAVYDLDSIAVVDEMRALASAAVHFTYAGDPPWTWPTRSEAAAFVDAYLAARGRPLDAGERARLDAGAIYALAYTARCEHGLGGATRPMGDTLAAAPDDYVAGG